ncbi:MAG: RNA polymerase sigma factor [Phycisphaerales bacterium]
MPRPPTIAELTRGVAHTDHARFDALHALYNPRVRAWACRTLPAALRHAAPDVEQETWLRVIRSVRPFDDEQRFERWLRSITLNAARDRIRSELRRARRERAARPGSAPHTTDAPDDRTPPVEPERLAAALRDIDAQSRALLDLRMRTTGTLDQIGLIVGLTPGAVDGRIRRTLARLKTALAPPNDDRSRPPPHSIPPPPPPSPPIPSAPAPLESPARRITKPASGTTTTPQARTP